jgi:carbon storage regulator
MLVLTRKPGQRILIGPDIIIEIREFHGNQVRIGIVAPKSINILREELKSRANREFTEDYS